MNDKKEPQLMAGNLEHTKDSDTRSTFAATKASDQKKVPNTSAGKKSPVMNKGKIAIAAVIFILVVAGGVFLISSFTSDPANIATVEGDKKTSSRTDAVKKHAPPSFDIVRMERGEIVVSGRAAPGEIVHILDNNNEIGREKADENGQWVFLPKKPLPVGNRRLTLFVIRDGNRVRGSADALLKVSKNEKDEVGVIMGEKKSTIIKAPRGQEIGALRIAKADYTEAGYLNIEGYAIAGRTVRVFLNGEIVGEAKGQNWSIEANRQLTSVTHALRADMMAADGKKVERRVEYRFIPTFIDDTNTVVMIKRGDNLWNIARSEYGRGANYVVIFEANRSQIKDPNLIYPNQVFNVPKKDGEFFNDNAVAPVPARAAKPAAKTAPTRKAPVKASARKSAAKPAAGTQKPAAAKPVKRKATSSATPRQQLAAADTQKRRIDDPATADTFSTRAQRIQKAQK